jgi:hypothetical protein
VHCSFPMKHKFDLHFNCYRFYHQRGNHLSPQAAMLYALRKAFQKTCMSAIQV